MKFTAWFAAVLLMLTLAVPRAYCAPQTKSSGKISGVVRDPDGKTVAHAAVLYQSAGGSEPHVVHTDASGHFVISGLRTDEYDLQASAHGMTSDWKKNVPSGPGKSLIVTLRLNRAAEPPQNPPQA